MEENIAHKDTEESSNAQESIDRYLGADAHIRGFVDALFALKATIKDKNASELKKKLAVKKYDKLLKKFHRSLQ